MGLLSSIACRQNHTYKACAIRRGKNLAQASIGMWNHFYEDFFSKEFLTDPQSYYLNAHPWSEPFIVEMCSQLGRARFLPFCSPRQP